MPAQFTPRRGRRPGRPKENVPLRVLPDPGPHRDLRPDPPPELPAEKPAAAPAAERQQLIDLGPMAEHGRGDFQLTPPDPRRDQLIRFLRGIHDRALMAQESSSARADAAVEMLRAVGAEPL